MAGRSDRRGSLRSWTIRHVRVSGRGKRQCWRVSRVMEPTREMEQLDSFPRVMGATRLDDFHKDPSGGRRAGSTLCLHLSRPKVGLAMECQGDTKVPGGML